MDVFLTITLIGCCMAEFKRDNTTCRNVNSSGLPCQKMAPEDRRLQTTRGPADVSTDNLYMRKLCAKWSPGTLEPIQRPEVDSLERLFRGHKAEVGFFLLLVSIYNRGWHQSNISHTWDEKEPSNVKKDVDSFICWQGSWRQFLFGLRI